MILLVLMLLFAAAVSAAVCLAGGAWWLGLLCFPLGLALGLVLYMLGVWLLSRRTDLSQPDARPHPQACAAVIQVGQMLCLLGGVRPVITGTEKLPEGERFLFVCNHRSMFDPLMVMGWLGKWSIAFISKPSNLRIPLVGPCAEAAGFLAIDRENDRKALRTILTAADYLKRDLCSIGIYPEGTRTRTGELQAFHSGSFKIAQRAHVPLVIACVHGTEKAKHGYFLHPHRCTLEILECLPAEQVKAMSTQELASCSREKIEACLKEAEGK